MREQRQVRVDSELSEELVVKVWIHQGTVLSHFLLALVVDVVSEFARIVLSKLLYADDLVLMSETIMGLREKVLKWKMCWSEKVDGKVSKKYYIQKMRRELERQWKKSCDDMDTVRKFAYFGDRASAGGGCEAAVIARTRCV